MTDPVEPYMPLEEARRVIRDPASDVCACTFAACAIAERTQTSESLTRQTLEDLLVCLSRISAGTGPVNLALHLRTGRLYPEDYFKNAWSARRRCDRVQWRSYLLEHGFLKQNSETS